MGLQEGAWLALQVFAGGLAAGGSALLFVYWRLERRDPFVFWTMAWLAPLALLLVLNAIVPVLEPGSTLNTAGLWLRSQALGLSVLLAIPAVASVTGGPRLRPWVLAVGGLLVLRAVLFLATDLVFAHEYVDGSPAYGPLITWTFAVPALLVATYVTRAMLRIPRGRGRALAFGASVLAFGTLAYAFILETGPLAELLTALWAFPIIALVMIVGVRRALADIGRNVRQREMRDALAALTNAAWFDRHPEQLLSRAETAARSLLRNEEVHAGLYRLPNDSFHASFTVPSELAGDAQASAFLDDLGHVVAAAAERYLLHERLEEAAHTDALTGLPNRRRLDAVVTEAWESVGDGTLAVLFCDLDAFKRINEEFGHPVGDSVLQRAAQALERTAPEGATVARYGGDEFVVVIPDAPEVHAVVEIAQSLQRAVAEAAPGKVRSMSVGVVVARADEVREPYTLVRDADSAMFEAKRKRLGVRVFDQSLRARRLREIDLSRRIARAVAEGEFEVHFQPIVDARSLEVVAVEALTRWPREAQRDIEDWVAVAEESGQIVPIGLEVVRAARRAAEDFALPVGVNVSPRQLAEPDLAAQLLDAWGPDRREELTLEITETALLDDLFLSVDTLVALRDEGVRIAIDDFGTGYSSLSRLSYLPVDVLKVDQQFARDATSPRGRAVLRGVIEIAHASGLRVVVEGVETVEQLEIITELGADQVQGFLLGRPSAEAPAVVKLPG